jgi:hypothetical protein
MASGAKFFELLDFTKFARPDVLRIASALTARELAARLGDGGFMSYGQIWPRMPDAGSRTHHRRFNQASLLCL